MVIYHFNGMRYASANTPNLPALTVFEIEKVEKGTRVLTYSPTLRTLGTNAANPVAINRYQFVRLLPARVVSVISTNCVYHLLIIFFALSIGLLSSKEPRL